MVRMKRMQKSRYAPKRSIFGEKNSVQVEFSSLRVRFFEQVTSRRDFET